MDFENVREALKSLIEYAEARELQVNGQAATVEQVCELMAEHAYNIADLLGMSDLYLGGDEHAAGVDDSTK